MEYEVKCITTPFLSDRDLSACLSIIESGEAVDLSFARAEVPIATSIGLILDGEEIVGVGAIKRCRPPYTAGIARKCGAPFPPTMLELGYVAIDPAHQGHGLAHRLTKELLSTYEGKLFATTSSPAMKRVLDKAGFEKHGDEWPGRNAKVSCWIR